MKSSREQRITKVLFFIYIIFLTWVILFKMQINLLYIGSMQYRNINFIPFQGSAVTNGKIDLSEIILNILAFIPYGIYISIIKENWNFIKKTAIIFFTSLAYESLQYIFAIGASDITDLFGNTLGGILGIVSIWLLSKVLKENTIKVINVLAIFGTFFILLLSCLLIITNI